MERNPDNQSTETDTATTSNTHSRRDMLKLASAVGAASLGTASLASTATATSESQSDATAPAATQDPSAPSAEQSDDVGVLAVNPGCIWESGNPGVTISGGSCAEHAYSNSWAYAGYILNTYPGIDACRTQVSVSGEIEAHAIFQPGESITIGCGGD